MAASTANDHESGTADREHLQTWQGFMKVVRWGVALNILLLIFLAIFRTHG